MAMMTIVKTITKTTTMKVKKIIMIAHHTEYSFYPGEVDSDAIMEDCDRQENNIDIEDDEEIDSDEDGDKEETEEGHMLDNIIVDVGSNPFQDDNLMMIDALENICSSLSTTRRPIGDVPTSKRSYCEHPALKCCRSRQDTFTM